MANKEQKSKKGGKKEGKSLMEKRKIKEEKRKEKG